MALYRIEPAAVVYVPRADFPDDITGLQALPAAGQQAAEFLNVSASLLTLVDISATADNTAHRYTFRPVSL